MKFKVIKKFIKGKTGEEINIGRVIDVAENQIEHFKELGIIDKPVRPKRKRKEN